jgi:nitrous oxidase accessory protein NosD
MSHILTLMVWLLLLPSGVFGETLPVGVGLDYSTIGDALKEAEAGDIIEVRGGEYRERLKIEKSIHLRGLDNPVIRAENGRIIEVTSPGVIIEGFTLRYESPNLAPADTAIFISKKATGSIIRHNRLINVMFAPKHFCGSAS